MANERSANTNSDLCHNGRAANDDTSHHEKLGESQSNIDNINDTEAKRQSTNTMEVGAKMVGVVSFITAAGGAEHIVMVGFNLV